MEALPLVAVRIGFRMYARAPYTVIQRAVPLA